MSPKSSAKIKRGGKDRFLLSARETTMIHLEARTERRLPMEKGARIRMLPDGSLRLPEEVLEKLGWRPGSYLEVSMAGGAVQLRRVEVDPFREAAKKPDADAFEKILSQQQKSQEDAFKAFEERVKAKDISPPRPEDRPDY